MPPGHVHCNGSVNLADAESVMREIAMRVPSGLRRIPDGETADRGNWIVSQFQKLPQLPWPVPARPLDAAGDDYEHLPQLRLADGADPAQAVWPDFGYADAYLASCRVFAALRERGVIPAGVRLHVQYPTRCPTTPRAGAGHHRCSGPAHRRSPRGQPGRSYDWGICAECGMGRAARDEIPALLDLHRQVTTAR